MFAESVSSTLSIWTSVNSWFTPTVLFVLLNLVIGTIAVASNFGGPPKPNHRHPSDPDQPQYLPRSPSVLQRIKSINPYAYRSEEPVTVYEKTPGIETHVANFEQPPQLVRSPSVLQRLKFSFYGYKSEESFQSEKTEEVPVAPAPAPAQIRRLEEEPKRVEQEADGETDGDQEPTLDEVYSKLNGDHFNRTKSDTKPTAGEFTTRLPRKMKKSASSKSAFSHFEAEEIVESRRPATVKEGRDKITEIDDEVDAKADDFINKFKQQLKLQRLESILKYKEMVGRGNAQ
ncbi:uncharacterized protein LOC111018736 [Momordica charantia]|uniref:Uncharacterized protein LOC111018736 n=1 Tax=Momordica charantia TaxID=3673 RepID=A0A6J1D983_MOMCH|nr:uncharacterized protein LOC111018736 [Momordica charantia]